MAVKELCFVKQGSINSGEFHAHITKIVKRCKFPNAEGEERAIRDSIFLGMNSTRPRNKAINLMNQEGKEHTVDFLMQQLEIEDCNTHHKSLSQLDSTTSVNFAAYDHRQNKSRKVRRTEVMERTGHRINLESRDLIILNISLENPEGWRTSA